MIGLSLKLAVAVKLKYRRVPYAVHALATLTDNAIAAHVGVRVMLSSYLHLHNRFDALKTNRLPLQMAAVPYNATERASLTPPSLCISAENW